AIRKASVLSNFERYQRIAWAYDLLDFPFEYGRYRKIRPLLFRGLSGRILEAGVGTGRNFPFYPPGSEVVGIDLSPAMLARAERRRPMAATEVELLQMDVTRLSFPDRSFDAAVAMFLFCTLPDELQVAGMRELGRVVTPGGIIRCLEYTRPSGGLRRAMTRLWECGFTGPMAPVSTVRPKSTFQRQDCDWSNPALWPPSPLSSWGRGLSSNRSPDVVARARIVVHV